MALVVAGLSLSCGSGEDVSQMSSSAPGDWSGVVTVVEGEDAPGVDLGEWVAWGASVVSSMVFCFLFSERGESIWQWFKTLALFLSEVSISARQPTVVGSSNWDLSNLSSA